MFTGDRHNVVGRAVDAFLGMCFSKGSDPAWMNKEILLAIRDRDKALKHFKNLKSPENHRIYCQLRNKIQYKVRKDKQFFFKDKIAQYRNSSSDFWKTLKKNLVF